MTIKDQPPPTPTSGRPIWDLVIEDMRERDRVGRERYGTPLQANNGRDCMVDAYQEALDLSVYLRQAIEERKPARDLHMWRCPLPERIRRIYLAAASAEVGRVQVLRRTLIRILDHDPAPWVDDVLVLGANPSDSGNLAHASKDLDAVAAADLVVVLAPVAQTIGAWIEMGAAIALGKPVVMIGDPPTIFASLCYKLDQTALITLVLRLTS